MKNLTRLHLQLHAGRLTKFCPCVSLCFLLILCALEGFAPTCSISFLSRWAGGYPTRFVCHRLLCRVLFQRVLIIDVSHFCQDTPLGRFSGQCWKADLDFGSVFIPGNSKQFRFAFPRAQLLLSLTLFSWGRIVSL